MQNGLPKSATRIRHDARDADSSAAGGFFLIPLPLLTAELAQLGAGTLLLEHGEVIDKDDTVQMIHFMLHADGKTLWKSPNCYCSLWKQAL